MKKLHNPYYCALSLVLLLASCSLETGNEETFNFLFFKVNGMATTIYCGLFILLQIIAIIRSNGSVTPGWRREKIHRKIYDKDGEVIGYYDTGEYKEWYISPERAEAETRDMNRRGVAARVILPRVCITGLLVSQIFKPDANSMSFWSGFFALVVWGGVSTLWSKFHLKEIREELAGQDPPLTWDWIYCIFLLILTIIGIIHFPAV